MKILLYETAPNLNIFHIVVINYVAYIGLYIYNYSDYLYYSLLSILVYCSGIYSVANKCKYARMEWNNNVHEKHVIARSYYLTWK